MFAREKDMTQMKTEKWCIMAILRRPALITRFYRDFYSCTSFPYLYLGLNLPKAPYGPIFWFFILVTLVLITFVNYWRYRYCLEEQVGISSHLTPKNLESTLLNFILLTMYGLSVVCYKNYWEKYVQSINQFGVFLTNFITNYQFQIATKSTRWLPWMAYPIFLPNNFTYDWTMPNCTENCAEKWQIASEGTALMIEENYSQFEKISSWP